MITAKLSNLPSPFSLHHEKLLWLVNWRGDMLLRRVQRDPSAGKSIHFRIKVR